MPAEAVGRSETGGSGGPLGNNAKSHAALSQNNDLGPFDRETGEFVQVRQSGSALVVVRDPAEVRLERFALQAVARELLPKTRTANCLRVPFRADRKVQVYHSPAHKSAHYGGLQTCASVWACPVCMAKITERRRVELQAAMAEAERQGLHVYLLTLTHPHSWFDPLVGLLTSEQQALKQFLGCRGVVHLFRDLGRVGQVRAWEVTHGRLRAFSHGWHPHFHILLFLSEPIGDLPSVESSLYVHWANACVRSGLERPSERFGVRLDDGSRAADYIAKMGLEEAKGWGFDSEMTKGHCKRAKDGETPLDLLRACLADPSDHQAAALFREYAAAFKGKRQLVWSRGLRDRLSLDAAPSDEELAAACEEDALLLAELTSRQWRRVLRLDARGELLEIARHGRVDALERFLVSLGAGSGAAGV